MEEETMKKQTQSLFIFRTSFIFIALFLLIGSSFLFLSEKEKKIQRYSVFYRPTFNEVGNPDTRYLYKQKSILNDLSLVWYGIDDRWILPPPGEYLSLSEIPYLSQTEIYPKDLKGVWDNRKNTYWDRRSNSKPVPISKERGSS